MIYKDFCKDIWTFARPGSARLETEDGIPVANPWNIQHLRKFYP